MLQLLHHQQQVQEQLQCLLTWYLALPAGAPLQAHVRPTKHQFAPVCSASRVGSPARTSMQCNMRIRPYYGPSYLPHAANALAHSVTMGISKHSFKRTCMVWRLFFQLACIAWLTPVVLLFSHTGLRAGPAAAVAGAGGDAAPHVLRGAASGFPIIGEGPCNFHNLCIAHMRTCKPSPH